MTSGLSLSSARLRLIRHRTAAAHERDVARFGRQFRVRARRREHGRDRRRGPFGGGGLRGRTGRFRRRRFRALGAEGLRTRGLRRVRLGGARLGCARLGGVRLRVSFACSLRSRRHERRAARVGCLAQLAVCALRGCGASVEPEQGCRRSRGGGCGGRPAMRAAQLRVVRRSTEEIRRRLTLSLSVAHMPPLSAARTILDGWEGTSEL